jgi:tetratricopeptide (TPR) repeat protein
MLTEALRIADSLQHPEEKAAQLAWLAGIYFQAGDAQRSRELFTRARLLAGAAETPALKAGALNQIVHEYLDAGLQSEAEIIIDELHNLVIVPENGLDKVSELIGLAGCCSAAGMFTPAGLLLEEAFQAAELVKDNWFKTQYFTSIAEQYAEMGATVKVIHVLEKAAVATGSIADINRPYFLLRIAQVYALFDLKTEAGDILTTTLHIVDQEEIAFSKCDDLLTIAEVSARLGKETQSDALLTQVQDITDNIVDLKDRISGYIKLAGTLDRLEQTGKALAMAMRALDTCGNMENQRTLMYLLGDIALLFAEIQQPEKAQAVVERIISMAQNPLIKTSGLCIVAADLAEAHQYNLALLLAGIIREPDARANAFISLAENLVDAGDNNL